MSFLDSYHLDLIFQIAKMYSSQYFNDLVLSIFGAKGIINNVT